MRDPRARRALMLWSALGLVLLAGGCQQPQIRLSPTERADLGRRARDLLLRATDSPDDVVAAHAMEALVDVDPAAGLPAFRQALQAPGPLKRYAGLVSLGRLRDRDSAVAYQRLTADTSPHVRLAAAFAALRCGGSEQVYAPPLAAALVDERDEEVRCTAADLLGRLGERRAIRRLAAAEQREASPRVTVHLVAAQSLLGDAAARDRLINYTQGDQMSRIIALQTLRDLGDQRAVEPLRDLLRTPASQEYYVPRLMAAQALGRLGHKDGFELALQIAEDRVRGAPDETERMKLRVNAALALGAIGDDRALPALQNLAQSDDERVQVAACYAILQVLRQRGDLRGLSR
jgi:HEAT repeat protein